MKSNCKFKWYRIEVSNFDHQVYEIDEIELQIQMKSDGSVCFGFAGSICSGFGGSVCSGLGGSVCFGFGGSVCSGLYTLKM